MAVRAPTGFTQYIDAQEMIPRQPVIVTGPNAAVNDMEFLLGKREMVWSEWMSRTLHTTSTSFVEVSRIRFILDRSGNWGTTEQALWYVFGWSTVASDFEYRLTNVGNASAETMTVGATHTTGSWRSGAMAGACNIYNDGTETELLLEMRVVTTGDAYIAGIGVWTAAQLGT
jgi:hypothetical protein